MNITYWTRFTEKSNFVFVSAFQEIVCTEKIRRMEPILNLISSELSYIKGCSNVKAANWRGPSPLVPCNCNHLSVFQPSANPAHLQLRHVSKNGVDKWSRSQTNLNFKQNLISFTCSSKTPVGDVTPEHMVVKYFQMAAREH